MWYYHQWSIYVDIKKSNNVFLLHIFLGMFEREVRSK